MTLCCTDRSTGDTVRLALLALPLLLLVLGGCASPPDPATPVQPVWTVRADLVGTPRAASGTVVSYVDSGDDALELVAWSRGSGRELWRRPAVLGWLAAYDDPSAEVASVGGDDYAVWLRDDPADTLGWQLLTVAGLDDGRPLDLVNPKVYARTLPAECLDGDGVCLRGWLDGQGAGQERELRLDVGSGVLGLDPTGALPAGSRPLGRDVFSTNDRAPTGVELLGHIDDGEVVWQRPYTDVFGPGSTSDGGWGWRDGSLPLLVGSGFVFPPESRGSEDWDYDPANGATVGLDPATGETRWRIDGSNGWCELTRIETTLLDDVVPLCLSEAGHVRVDRSDPDDIGVEGVGLATTLLGVDIETGEVRFRLDVGGDIGVLAPDGDSFRSRTALRPVTIDGHTVMVDILSGETSNVKRGERLACERDREDLVITYRDPIAPGLQHIRAGKGVFPCGEHLREVDGTALSRRAVLGAGLDAGGGVFVVDGLETLAAYRPGAT
jgi:hypothetical protein